MKRRGFFGALGALIAGAAVAKPAVEPPVRKAAVNSGASIEQPIAPLEYDHRDYDAKFEAGMHRYYERTFNVHCTVNARKS